MKLDHLDWPFFDAGHRDLGSRLHGWIDAHAGRTAADADVDAACRAWVRELGEAGWLRYCVPARYGGALAGLDSRSLCVVRETLAYHDPLADFAFAMQGLGSGALTLAGSDPQRSRWLPGIARGELIAAFALSEPGAGSDASALAARARRVGDEWILDGCKTWVSNGGIADFYCVFARSGKDTGARGISAFVVPADAPGLAIVERLEVIAPHPLARIELRDCRLPAAALLGPEGEGFALAMQTLDIFRASVAAAATGMARHALDLALAHAGSRRMFGGALGDRDLARAALGELATLVDASALLTYRAGWRRDVQKLATTSEAAMAKMGATEAAQKVIDVALQMHGGEGVRRGAPIERLYREIRALRIYEGATELQKLIIGREALQRA